MSDRYFAFISYSHRDERWAAWLHKALEGYRVPSRLVGQTTAAGTIPRRLTPVFRDRDDLASATDLSRKVDAALYASQNLIVICSRQSATSRWVNDEILAFKRLGGGERVFCLIVDGEPNASVSPGREAEECFAPALRSTLDATGQLTSTRTEPIAADVRVGKDRKANAKLKLIAGLLDVGFDTLKQREQHRRMRRLALIATAAVVVMLVTTTLAVVAILARSDAERRQRHAENLVGFMLGDLNDKLSEVQRLDLLEAVDDKAMAYFQALPTNDVNDEALAQRAKALEKIGNVRVDQGRLDAALEAYESAAKLTGPLAVAAPDNVARLLAHANSLEQIGKVHWYQGSLETATQDFESAQRILGQATPLAARDNPLRFHATVIANNVGHVLEARGKLEEAAVQYRAMLADCERLVADDPHEERWQLQLGYAHNNLGKIALLDGDLPRAIAEYRADSDIETVLLEADPRNSTQRENVITARAILGRTLALAGHSADGIAALRQSLDMVTPLIANDPENMTFREDFALYSAQLARLERIAGNAPEAAALVAHSLETFVLLTGKDPKNVVWQREHADATIEHAAQLLAAGRRAEAGATARQAIDRIGPLLEDSAGNHEVVLAAAGARLIDATAATDPTAASARRGEAVQLLVAVNTGIEDPRLLALLAEALFALDRRGEALAVLDRLWKTGYRDRALEFAVGPGQVSYPQP